MKKIEIINIKYYSLYGKVNVNVNISSVIVFEEQCLPQIFCTLSENLHLNSKK